MAKNYGKEFEAKFKENWLSLVESDLIRLMDVMSGYKRVKNIADFICYKYPFIFYLDCKSLEGNTFNFSKLTQWDKMVEHMNIPGVNVGAIIWFIDHDKVCYVPIEEFVKLKKLNYKSIHVKMIGDKNFEVYEIPSTKLRTFMNSDYSILIDIANTKYNKNNSQNSPD